MDIYLQGSNRGVYFLLFNFNLTSFIKTGSQRRIKLLFTGVWTLSALFLAGCIGIRSVSYDPPPSFRLSPSGAGNSLQLTSENGVSILNIESESGIGSAEIELLEGQPPLDVEVHLQLKGLEEFRLQYANQEQTVSFSSGASPQLTQNLGSVGAEAPLDPSSPQWLEVTIVSENPSPGIPLESGYFSITMPADLFRDNKKVFSIEWIDFYR